MVIIMTENDSRSSLRAKFEAINAVILGWICMLLIATLMIGIASIPINWLQGLIVPWMVEHVPWLFMIATIILLPIKLTIVLATASLILVVPVSLGLLVFQPTKGLGAKGLMYISATILGNIWFSSVVLSLNLAGLLWLIIGLLFGGIGVIPIAFVMALLNADWMAALAILGGLALSVALASWATNIFNRQAAGRKAPQD